MIFYNEMTYAERLMRAAFISDEKLRDSLREVLSELGLSAREFSKISAIPQSTLYKIMSGHREPNITTLRQIVKTIKEIEGADTGFIAVIAARPVLDEIKEKRMKIGDRLLVLREYSATNIEEAIVAAVRAERDGPGPSSALPSSAPQWRSSSRSPWPPSSRRRAWSGRSRWQRGRSSDHLRVNV
jgi:transcriptional regulator, XRE family